MLSKHCLKGFWITVILIVDTGVLSYCMQSLPKKLNQMWINVVQAADLLYFIVQLLKLSCSVRVRTFQEVPQFECLGCKWGEFDCQEYYCYDLHP